jgi:hypothetical protein
MEKDKPPDIYKCKKQILKNIIKDDLVLVRIKEAVIKMNKAIIIVYQFMKSYYLYQMKNNKVLPKISQKYIKNCFLICCEKDNRGPPLSENTIKELKPMLDYYNNDFTNFVKDKPKINKLNQVKNYCITSMITAFNNNISIHFINRVFRYINKIFSNENKYELRKIKDDLLNKPLKNDMKSNEKYHKWINENRYKILPKSIKKSYYYDVKCSPLKYLPYMIYINNELEKMEQKQFHCFPLRNDIVPKYIEIDTSALLEIMIDKDSKKFRNGKGQIENSKNILWNTFFKLNKMKYNKNYIFDNAILTDGIGVSIRFIHKNNKNNIELSKNKENNLEFEYITDLDDIKLNEIKRKNIVYIDPNKNALLYCMDNNEKYFKYTRAQRLKETQRLKNQKIINKYKKQNKLKELETEISKENSKTCNYDKFINFIKIKNNINEKLFIYYEEEFIRKLKLRTFINKQRSEGKLIRNLKNLYGENTVYIIGNGNVNPSMKHIISTPNKGLKRLLKKNFELYQMDEFRTSCLDYRTTDNNLIKNKNCDVILKNGKRKKLHSVLVSKILNRSSGCYLNSFQQRDKNSVKNIKKIIQQYLKDKTRPYWYRRDIKLPDKNIYLEENNDC